MARIAAPARRLAVLLGLAACGRERATVASGATTGTATDSMPASGTRMAGDSMRMMAAPLLPGLRAHLDSLASPDATMRRAAMTSDSQAMGALLGAMRTDLMHLGLQNAAAYQALADSVVRNEAAIARAPAAAQARLLDEHVARVRRLTATYGRLVASAR